MINETIFIIHALLIYAIGLIALRVGLEAVTAFAVLCGIAANFFILKQISLFGFEVTATDAFAVDMITLMNLVQEYYGRKSALRILYLTFAGMIIFTLFSLVHLWYVPSMHDVFNAHYVALLSISPRIIIASLISFFISQTVDYKIFSFLSSYWSAQPLVLRYGITVIFSQLVDTLLFSFLGLYGIVHTISHIIVLSYCMKLAAIVLATPFVMLSRKIVRRSVR